jgi:hypothetical protein
MINAHIKKPMIRPGWVPDPLQPKNLYSRASGK